MLTRLRRFIVLQIEVGSGAVAIVDVVLGILLTHFDGLSVALHGFREVARTEVVVALLLERLAILHGVHFGGSTRGRRATLRLRCRLCLSIHKLLYRLVVTLLHVTITEHFHLVLRRTHRYIAEITLLLEGIQERQQFGILIWIGGRSALLLLQAMRLKVLLHQREERRVHYQKWKTGRCSFHQDASPRLCYSY